MRRAAVLAAALAVTVTPTGARAESPALPPMKALDLLIVVDSSSDAAEERAAFADRLLELTSWLEQSQQPAFDLHVGVITTDIADGGRLRRASTSDCPEAPSDPYVIRYAYGGGNYVGQLAYAVRCLLPTASGTSASAASPQPFKTIAAALDGSVTDNSGFLRPEAALAILVVTTHDDCSTTDGSSLDPLACAIAGWGCGQPLDETPGVRTGCEVRATAAAPLVSAYALSDFLVQLKPRDAVALGILAGRGSPVKVVAGPALAPSCATAEGKATPPIRLVHGSGMQHPWVGDICAGAGLVGFYDALLALVADPPPIRCDFSGGDDAGHPIDPGNGDRPPPTGCVGCASGGGDPSAAIAPLLLVALAFARAGLSGSRRASGARRSPRRRRTTSTPPSPTASAAR